MPGQHSLAATRLAENHASMYGAVDIASEAACWIGHCPDGTTACHAT